MYDIKKKILAIFLYRQFLLEICCLGAQMNYDT